jgi:hypothetical protein
METIPHGTMNGILNNRVNRMGTIPYEIINEIIWNQEWVKLINDI